MAINQYCEKKSDYKGGKSNVIAFYAPLKSPLHPIPSGDRKIAQLFIQALEKANFNVELASQLRSFDKKGNQQRQQRMISLARKEAARILKRWRKYDIQPIAWFSYHLYYKAPDLIGPIICKSLSIPYIIAEASWAQKRQNGPWSMYHSHVNTALALADKIICINPVDKIALDQYFKTKTYSPICELKPFTNDVQTLHKERKEIADTFGLEPSLPWLITIAMMRNGDKFHSYTILQDTIKRLKTSHQLLIIGDGEKKEDIKQLFCHNNSTFFAGQLSHNQIAALLPHFQLLIWPAINEALGMVFLEAQQAGVSVVAGDQGGVSSVVKDKFSGLVLPMVTDDELAEDMSYAIDNILNDHEKLLSLKKNAKQYIHENHSLTAAAKHLHSIVADTLQHFRNKAC